MGPDFFQQPFSKNNQYLVNGGSNKKIVTIKNMKNLILVLTHPIKHSKHAVLKQGPLFFAFAVFFTLNY